MKNNFKKRLDEKIENLDNQIKKMRIEAPWGKKADILQEVKTQFEDFRDSL